MTIEKIDFSLELNPPNQRKFWLFWFYNHSGAFALIIAALVLLIAPLLFFWGRSYENAVEDFMSIELSYRNWASQTSLEEELISQIDKQLETHPELYTKYQPLIIKHLIEINEGQKADLYAKKNGSLNYFSEDNNYYEQFAATSLLIAKDDLSTALEEAIDLKKTMEENLPFWETQNSQVPFGTTLYLFNLLRIAILEKEVGTPLGELGAWAELEKETGWSDSEHESKFYNLESIEVLEKSFRKHGVSLQDYIRYRRDLLEAGS